MALGWNARAMACGNGDEAGWLDAKQPAVRDDYFGFLLRIGTRWPRPFQRVPVLGRGHFFDM
jgi:hypothetical protein